MTRPFELADPLPGPGVTVIEASAGTGKTFTLAALAARFIAEGLEPSRLLAVTFTRMATGELRERVRTRLATAEVALGRSREGEALPAGDDLVGLLASGSSGQVLERQQRLADAVARFDALTVTTTHGFCQLMLRGLGATGDVDVETELLEDPTDLVDEVVADLYLRHALRHGPPAFSLRAAGAAAREAVANPDAAVLPPPAPDTPLSRLAERARGDVAQRLRDAGLLTYDQLLDRLARTLADDERGPAACARLRERYEVVLVDEFQDTDPVQWQVLRRAFGSGPARLVLIGDPKQAIYAFRGADVHAYLAANRDADRRTLHTNWRADQPLLDATDALLAPLLFGHPEIPYRSVRAAPGRGEAGLRGAPSPSPFRVRVLADKQAGVRRTASQKLLEKPAAVEWIARDLARDVAGLLASGATVPAADGRRRIDPEDVAVLTRTNPQARTVRDALRAAGVPAVAAGLETVFESDAARDWLRLLDAAQEPASRPRIVALALSAFVGMTALGVATADERRWEQIHDRAHRWAAVLAAQGVATLHRVVTAEEGLPARLLSVEGGERMLTDLQHVAELLHAEAVQSQLGAPALRAWLSARIADAADGRTQPEERSRRLDSDAEAVQVLTVHRAKGLEFGVVYCPYLWDPVGGPERRDAPVLFHLPTGDGRYLDVGAPLPAGAGAYAQHVALSRDEQRGEDLRILYVALTRARHQVVLWWARTHGCRHSPLGRLLVQRREDGSVGPGWSSEPDEGAVQRALEPAAERAPGLFVVERPEAPAPAPAGPAGAALALPEAGPASGPGGLRVAVWDRSLDRDWRRSSYSSIVAPGHRARVGSEPEQPGTGDEPLSPAGAAVEAAPGPDPAAAEGDWPACPLAGLPRGPEVGTFVHGLLETADFDAPDIAARLGAEAASTDPTGALGGRDPALGAGLAAALATPLGPLFGGASLRDVARRDRLDELTFEMPVAGGDHPRGAVRTADIGTVLGRHLRAGDPLDGYAERLDDPLLAATLRGYLTGSLDLVVRRRGSDGGERWFVVDYKTNWLGPREGPLSTWHYRPAALAAEMQHQHYPLQAALYLVALHRYLGWRLPGYDPERHLGGVLYLFLRGMVGPTTPHIAGQPAGVFAWKPPADLVTGLSALFDEGSP